MALKHLPSLTQSCVTNCDKISLESTEAGVKALKWNHQWQLDIRKYIMSDIKKILKVIKELNDKVGIISCFRLKKFSVFVMTQC